MQFLRDLFAKQEKYFKEGQPLGRNVAVVDRQVLGAQASYRAQDQERCADSGDPPRPGQPPRQLADDQRAKERLHGEQAPRKLDDG